MRNIALLTILIVISGCTVSARNHHFELIAYTAKDYDDFNNIWCFTAKQNSLAIVCSPPYKRRSESIGIIVPVVPQSNRDSRLAYDINRARVVEFKNTNAAIPILLSELGGIERCANEYAKECASNEIIAIKPNTSVWLRIPSGEIHEFSMSVGNKKYRAALKEFDETRWHSVSV